MRLTLVTDAYTGQINGVVRTLETTVRLLTARGHSVTVLHPQLFKTIALPSYQEIRIARNPWKLGTMIEQSTPDSLHIAVEGSLGLAAKLWAGRRDYHYTTSYHTRFPEYIEAHYGAGLDVSYRVMRAFHRHSSAVLANTQTMLDELRARKFRNLMLWGRGVDALSFCPDGPLDAIMAALPRPLLLNVGRVSTEKNLPAFYTLPNPGTPHGGTKVQIGDGPMLASYRRAYPDVVFLGARSGAALAACYRAADVFVFPSLTDTFGLVMLESIASGVPVAAYPVAGPNDVITDGLDGALDADLGRAVTRALRITDTASLRASALRRDWEVCTSQFERCLVPLVASAWV
jgi:glycosyltransferase involved in cell wall biosynthesis